MVAISRARNVAPQVVREVGVANLAALIRGNREVLVPFGERLVV